MLSVDLKKGFSYQVGLSDNKLLSVQNSQKLFECDSISISSRKVDFLFKKLSQLILQTSALKRWVNICRNKVAAVPSAKC